MSNVLKLDTNIDQFSRTWAVVSDHCKVRIAELQAKLEGGINWELTQEARAQIKELRGILALNDAPEPPLVEQDFELPG